MRPLQPHRVPIGDAERRKQRGTGITDERGVEMFEAARPHHDEYANDGGEEHTPCGGTDRFASDGHGLMPILIPREPSSQSAADSGDAGRRQRRDYLSCRTGRRSLGSVVVSRLTEPTAPLREMER